MITENLSTLKINKLSQAQYDRELAAGNIEENALYLTPAERLTKEEVTNALGYTPIKSDELTTHTGNTDIHITTEDRAKWDENIPPVPTETQRGGIIAAAKDDTYIQEVKLGADGKLYVPARNITYGTEDLTAGESELATGSFYFVYE